MAQPLQAFMNARDEGEAARHALRMERQAAIREGRYLPPLPHLPIIQPPRHLPMELFEGAMEFQLQNRRQFLLDNIRPAAMQQPGFFNPRPEDDYRPLSPTQSDDEGEEEEEVLELQRRVRRNWRHYMNMRAEPIPQEIIDRLIHENDRMANVARINNNNDNFRNFNVGMLSPSPSPSPAVSPAPSEDMDPIDQAREIDADIEMLNAQLFDMRPNQPRPRKRHNSDEEVPIKRKRVTFKEEVVDEVLNVFEEHSADYNDNIHINREQYDDDDEGFFGGPSAQQNISCA